MKYTVFILLLVLAFSPSARAQEKDLGLLNKAFVGERQPPANAFGQSAQQRPRTPHKRLPKPNLISNKPVNLNGKEKKALKLSKEWKERPVNPFMVKNGQIIYTYGATMPSIVCAPFMPSDVELQPGEIVNDVILADSARWAVNIGRSGPPNQESVHLVFKPFDSGLQTGAVVMTNRRTYHLKLVSNKEDFTPSVGFVYPEDQKAALKAQLEKQQRQKKWNSMPVANNATVDLAKLDFAYRISGDASWKPVQVYNDGTRTIIRLPESASKEELPVLLVEKADETQMVNYRVRGNGYVVDGPFLKCILIAGVGDKQEKVEIERVVKE